MINRQEHITELGGKCENAILSFAKIFEQSNAALGIYPPERCEAIKSYIAACRNEYLRCKALIMAAQTNDEADAVRFLAPARAGGDLAE